MAVAVVLMVGAAGWFVLPEADNPGFQAVASLAGEMATAVPSAATPSTTQRLATTTSIIVTTTTAPPPTTTAPEPSPPPPPSRSPSTTVDLSRADDYGCTHANGCLPYGGDGRTSGDAQHEWGCEQGYITEGC